MRPIEKPPVIDNYLVQGFKAYSNPAIMSLINTINEKYYYWDKVKHLDVPNGLSNEDLWAAIKLSRTFHTRKVSFGSYEFKYNLTDFIQKNLHEFDLNIGGKLGTKAIIPHEDKKRYLVSSIMEEAIASSQIEGAVTTRKKAKEMLRKSKKPKNTSEQMIVNNYATINHIIEIQNEKLTKEKLFEIHRLITNKTLDNEDEEGRYRINNEINVVDVSDGEVVYCPPDYKEIPELIDQLCSFFNNENDSQFIHPIIKGCIIHFMIGFIHPFVDGNGRTARALFYWYLLSKGYWLTEYLSISRLIVKSKIQYAKAFLYSENDENDISYFLNYKLKTMSLAYLSLQEYIERKINEKKRLIDFQILDGINERQAQIIKWVYEESDILFTIKEIETRFLISYPTARTDLYDLVQKGYLKKISMNLKKQGFCKSENFESLIKPIKKI